MLSQNSTKCPECHGTCPCEGSRGVGGWFQCGPPVMPHTTVDGSFFLLFPAVSASDASVEIVCHRFLFFSLVGPMSLVPITGHGPNVVAHRR